MDGGILSRAEYIRFPISIFTREAKGLAFPFLADIISAFCSLLWTKTNVGKDFAFAFSKRSNDT